MFHRTEQKRRNSYWAVSLASLMLALPLAFAGPGLGADLLGGFNWQNFEYTTYAPGSNREIADCRVERVFADHRKVGFFRVRLLPVLVVQGVRLEFAAGAAGADWEQGFRPDWLPALRRGDVEWRDVSVTFKVANAPRLHAGQAFPQIGGGATVCKFEDVTLEAGGQTWRLPRAELRVEKGSPFAIWQDTGGGRRLDMITGEISEP